MSRQSAIYAAVEFNRFLGKIINKMPSLCVPEAEHLSRALRESGNLLVKLGDEWDNLARRITIGRNLPTLDEFETFGNFELREVSRETISLYKLIGKILESYLERAMDDDRIDGYIEQDTSRLALSPFQIVTKVYLFNKSTFERAKQRITLLFHDIAPLQENYKLEVYLDENK